MRRATILRAALPLFALTFATGIGLFTGCGGENPLGPGADVTSEDGAGAAPYEYRPLTTPDALIHNLEVSYRLRDIEKYAELFAPEFVFWFQPEQLAARAAAARARVSEARWIRVMWKSPIVFFVVVTPAEGRTRRAPRTAPARAGQPRQCRRMAFAARSRLRAG